MRVELAGVACPVLNGVTVGIQRGKQVVAEHPVDGQDIVWLVDVQLVQPRPDLRGPFVHGRPGARFLYLSWQRDRQGMFRRVKVMLDSVPPVLLSAQRSGFRGRLSLTMPDGTPLCGAVRPPAVTWSAL